MKTLLQLLSLLGLVLTVVPSLLVFLGKIPWELHSQLMLAGMVLWFVTAPFWMKEKGTE